MRRRKSKIEKRITSSYKLSLAFRFGYSSPLLLGGLSLPISLKGRGTLLCFSLWGLICEALSHAA